VRHKIINSTRQECVLLLLFLLPKQHRRHRNYSFVSSESVRVICIMEFSKNASFPRNESEQPLC
jgi:hypothetical protein